MLHLFDCLQHFKIRSSHLDIGNHRSAVRFFHRDFENRSLLDLRGCEIAHEFYVEDLSITGEVGQTMIRNKAKYVRTMQELNAAYMAFCAKMLGSGYEKVSIKTLAVALLEVMEDLFELFESEAIKVILYHGNRPKFADIIERALKQYAIILQRRRAAYRAKGYVKYTWEVPADRFYKEDTNRVCPKIENHALMPYIFFFFLFSSTTTLG